MAVEIAWAEFTQKPRPGHAEFLAECEASFREHYRPAPPQPLEIRPNPKRRPSDKRIRGGE